MLSILTLAGRVRPGWIFRATIATLGRDRVVMRDVLLLICCCCVSLSSGCLQDNPRGASESAEETGAGHAGESGPELQHDVPSDVASDAELAPWCGDGQVDEGERCDDGNDVPDDGCEWNCEPSRGVSFVSVGQRPFSCAVSFEGELMCFGTNEYGELGLGTFEHVGDDEVPMSVGPVFIWADVESVAAGGYHGCALDDEGGVWCWGMADVGQCGLGSAAHQPYPEAKVPLGAAATQVVSGLEHSCALRDDGAVACWGSNAHGQVGYPGLEAVGVDQTPYAAGTVMIGADALQLAAGGNTTCAVLADGTVRCWGANQRGQLGLGHGLDIGDDEHPVSAAALDFGVPAVAVSVGRLHACALLNDDTVRCWGEGPAHGHPGHLTVGLHELATSFPAVEVGESVVEVAAGGTQTCVRNQKGEVWCFGRGTAGLGQGPGYPDVIGDDEAPSHAARVDLGAPARSLSAGAHVCARLAGGGLRCFGVHIDGALGLPWLAPGTAIGDDEAPASEPAVALF